MQSTTHSVLNCFDIMEEIFSWLGVHDCTGRVFREELRGTLYSAALACRVLSCHALDSLWHTLDEVHPLLALLPPYSYDESHDACIFLRTLEPQEWSRFGLYARRVRALTYDAGYELPVHVSVWMHLRDHGLANGTPLLPRLEILVLKDLSTADIGPVLALPSPTLCRLSISFERGQSVSHPASPIPIFAMALNTIVALSPDLYTLHLGHTFVLTSDGVLALAHLGRLTKLSFCQCGRCAIPDLRGFWTGSPVPASLRVLELAVQDIPGDFTVGPGGLRALRELRVHGSPGDIDNFIRGIRPSRLHTVEIVSWRASEFDTGGSPSYLSSICRNLPSTTLWSLELNLDVASGPEIPLSCFLSTIIEALRPLSNLTAVTLHGGAKPIVLSEDSIRLLGELCPRLRSLKITQFRSPPHSSLATLLELAEIARSCPALESLSLPRLESAKGYVGVPAMSHELRFLEFQEVGGDTDLRLVASAIAKIFPRLQLTTLEDSRSVDGGEGYGEWQHVRAIFCEKYETK